MNYEYMQKQLHINDEAFIFQSKRIPYYSQHIFQKGKKFYFIMVFSFTFCHLKKHFSIYRLVNSFGWTKYFINKDKCESNAMQQST